MKCDRGYLENRGFPMLLVVWAVSAYPDDIEMVCGGTLARLQEYGVEVHCVVMSKYGEELSEEESDIRKKELWGSFQDCRS